MVVEERGQYCGDEPPSYLIKSEEEIGESSGMSEGMIGESLDSSELPDSEMGEPEEAKKTAEALAEVAEPIPDKPIGYL